MAKIGDIKINKIYKKYTWAACVDCGKERWVELIRGQPKRLRCLGCAMKRVSKKPVMLYPVRGQKEAYIKDYRKDLEGHYDTADNYIYKNRIFCKDCPDFEICKGRLWEHCPLKAEALEIIKGV